MLKHVLIGCGWVCVVAAAVLLAVFPVTFALALWLGGLGLLLTLGFAIERWKYRQTRAPGGEWQATDERFFDEEKNCTVQVYYNPVTGQRRYVPEGHSVDKPQTGSQ